MSKQAECGSSENGRAVSDCLGAALGLAMIFVALAGCASPARVAAVPTVQTAQATIYGIPNARFVLGENRPVALIAEFRRAYERELAYYRGRPAALPAANYLAVSGGGDNGAFGAGLLVGWSERGTRPNFKAVTGISTGALTAPFAFLGPEYDQALTDTFTNVDAKDVFEKRSALAVLTEDAVADTKPLLKRVPVILKHSLHA